MSETIKDIVFLRSFKLSYLKKAVKNYSFLKFRKDLVAGLTVAIVALPQSMAYAIIAGINPKYGLYAAIVPAIVSSLFGSSKYLIAGPTNAISMVVSSTLASTMIAGTLVQDFPQEQKMQILFLLAFMVGMIQVVMGIAKFGQLINFVSHSVVIGFTAGAGVLIAFNQLKNILGIKLPVTNEFIETLRLTFTHINETNLFALLLGLFTIIFILASRKISNKIPGALLAMALSALAVYFFRLEGYGVKLIGEIPRSLPPLSSFSLNLDLVKTLFPSALAIALLGIVEALSISKSIANASGEKIDGNQEFIGQGLSNISASFFSGFPGSGSFTRSAVNFAAGAATRFSGVFSGAIVLLTLLILAPLARYIPIASLAGILIVIAYSMVDKQSIVLSFKATKADRTVLIATVLATLFLELEFAVYIGVILSIALFLRKVSHAQAFRVTPRAEDHKLIKYVDGNPLCSQISIYQIEGALFFGAIGELEEKLHELEDKTDKVIILRMKGIRLLDATGAHALIKFLEQCAKKKTRVILTGVLPDIKIVFERLSLMEKLLIAKDTTEAIKLSCDKYIDKSACRICKAKMFKECA